MGLGDEFASALDWWVEAGVDALVDDAPRDWLAPKPKPQAIIPAAASVAVAATAPAASLLPADLAGFQAWLADPANLPALGPTRLPLQGDPAAGLMILTDMPDVADMAAGALLSGDVGKLFDRMLAAIGLDRGRTYIASLLPARPPGGRIDRALAQELVEIARHHLALAAPRIVLLIGDKAVQAMTGLDMAAARHGKQVLNHSGGTVAAIATFHPRFLIQHGACKADSWRDLRMLDQELRR
jgi:DNA polymerase